MAKRNSYYGYYLRLEAGPTRVEAGVVEVAGELFSEVPLDVDPGAEPL